MKARWERWEGEREDVRLGESQPAQLAVLCGCEIKVLAAKPCSKKREQGRGRQILLDYITSAPPPNLTRLLHNTASYAGQARVPPLPIARLLFFAPALVGWLRRREHEQKTQFGSSRYCLYGRNKNKNPGDEVYRKEVVALDKCQTVTQFTRCSVSSVGRAPVC